MSKPVEKEQTVPQADKTLLSASTKKSDNGNETPRAVGDGNEVRGDLAETDFLRAAESTYRWIGEYLANGEKYPVLSQTRPGDIRAQLPSSPPRRGEAVEAMLRDFETILLPGVTHWNHPGFMAYFANSAPGISVLAESLSAVLNQNAMLWRTSPAATELEETVTDWVRQMLGLPEPFRGVITDTASISTLLALAAGRERIPGLNVREKGLAGRADVPRLRLYASEWAHSSVEKAAITLGIGLEGVRKISTNDAFEMRVDVLEAAIQQDREAGWLPFAVVATVGTTSTTAVDPVPEIAAICRRGNLWLHVDAAYGGATALVPEYQHFLDGCAQADSLVVNPHKWMFVPMDCSLLYVRNPDELKRAFSLVPDYLTTSEDATNYMDWGVQLGRRFRALKLWMVIRYFGVEGLAAHIRRHIALAQEFAGWIDSSPGWERTAPAPMSTVCFRANPQGINDETERERLNMALLDAINRSGEIFLSHTKLHGKYTLRLAIGNLRTEARHLVKAKTLLQTALDEARAKVAASNAV